MFTCSKQHPGGVLWEVTLPSSSDLLILHAFMSTNVSKLLYPAVYTLLEVGVGCLLYPCDKTWQMCLGSGVQDLPHRIRLKQSERRALCIPTQGVPSWTSLWFVHGKDRVSEPAWVRATEQEWNNSKLPGHHRVTGGFWDVQGFEELFAWILFQLRAAEFRWLTTNCCHELTRNDQRQSHYSPIILWDLSQNPD